MVITISKDLREISMSYYRKTSFSHHHFTIFQRNPQWTITISQDLRGKLIHSHVHKIWDETSTSHGQFIRPQRETIINYHHLTRSIRKILRELRETQNSQLYLTRSQSETSMSNHHLTKSSRETPMSHLKRSQRET